MDARPWQPKHAIRVSEALNTQRFLRKSGTTGELHRRPRMALWSYVAYITNALKPVRHRAFRSRARPTRPGLGRFGAHPLYTNSEGTLTMAMQPLTELTATLARQAIELHRLAKAAEDTRVLKSPTNNRPEDGIPRPTEDTALCPRRAHVSDTSDRVARDVAALSEKITDALDVWEGRKAP